MASFIGMAVGKINAGGPFVYMDSYMAMVELSNRRAANKAVAEFREAFEELRAQMPVPDMHVLEMYQMKQQDALAVFQRCRMQIVVPQEKLMQSIVRHACVLLSRARSH